ncbi:flavodoxin family protein [Portibacter lacus]|uniref:NADPH-dependent FMN reductase-like domain-containing protein n=1 Tax=Portibacter lacus TaxID=1099794 RepID=A0AA37WBD2_9BACT|nr:NAD(P)H-dependent oxidoreductase [Portibacter lacus]GLR15521.1 hypothetical protein GCM10007940_01360 [Portibacter lacus]
MLIIQGSHRKNGNTNLASTYLNDQIKGEVVHLNDFEIAHFNYEGPTDDDFLQIIEKIIAHKEVTLVTPIFWYTMSGKMKVFLDRISDLLKWNKETGRKLRGLKLNAISVSIEDDAPLHFPYPFEMTADYLGMKFGQYIHCYGDELSLSDESYQRISEFTTIAMK